MALKKAKVFIFLLTTLTLTGMAGFFQGCVQPPPSASSKPGGLVPGDKAYDFSLMDSTGHLVKQADLKPGWYLVLILYRAPGAAPVRDNWRD